MTDDLLFPSRPIFPYDPSVQIRIKSSDPCLYQAISKKKSMIGELPDGDLTPDPLLISGPHRGQAGK